MSAYRGITTLKDVFPEIKKEYKRNFLNENKKKIKDIQKVITTRKQIEKEKEEENDKRNKRLQERLARSTTRNPDSRSITDISSLKRSKSNQSNSIKSLCTCGSKLDSPPVSAKSTTSIDKEVQTDYTLEESYRNSKSLQGSQEILLPLQATDNLREDMEQSRNLNVNKDESNKEENTEVNRYPIFHQTMSAHDQRLESSSNPFLYKENVDYLKPYHEVPKSDDWNNKFDKLKLNDEVSVMNSEIFKKKSARSISSNNCTSRGEIKLPKYLEREKKEKELQRLRELERDPDCPDGFMVLDEKTRLENLEILQRGFQSLIDELNRLPMTSVTLRVKNRKNEIEKELVILENKIRFYQKSKIYIKYPPSPTHNI